MAAPFFSRDRRSVPSLQVSPLVKIFSRQTFEPFCSRVVELAIIEQLSQPEMERTVLITGGAGFIASHCAAALLHHGYRVRAFDNLDPQIHGADRRPPAYLDRRVELLIGISARPRRSAAPSPTQTPSCTSPRGLASARACTRWRYYTDVNSRGTAVLLEAMIEQAGRPAGRRIQHEHLRRRPVSG